MCNIYTRDIYTESKCVVCGNKGALIINHEQICEDCLHESTNKRIHRTERNNSKSGREAKRDKRGSRRENKERRNNKGWQL